jgi:cytochrome c-type biogenesis protein CcsB
LIIIGQFLYFKYSLFWIKVVSVLSSILILLFSIFVTVNTQPINPSLKSGWIFFHVLSYFIAYASFAIGFGLSIVYLILYFKKRIELNEKMNNLEGLIFRIIDFGFPFLTLGIAAGAVWANISWGRFFNWDAKEVWALVTWLIYSGCLHLRHSRNIKGVYAAVISLLGFTAIVFTYIGVNILFPASIHGY